MKKILVSFLSLMLTGCGLIGLNPNVTPEQRAETIYSLSKSGTIVAISELKDTPEKQEELANQIVAVASDVMTSLDQSPTLDNTLHEFTGSDLDRKYLALIDATVSLVKLHVSVKTPDEVLDDESVLYVSKFLQGIIDGSTVFVR